MGLGLAATGSLLLALVVLTAVADTPSVGRWFLASAVLAGLAYLAAIVSWHFDA
jgi:hypothetical protein